MREYNTKSNIAFKTVVYAIMVLVLLVCLIPFLYIISLSLSDPIAVVNGEVFVVPVGFSVEAYRQIFTYPNFFNAYLNTIIYTVFGTAISLFVMTLFAYPLSKPHLRGQSIIMKLVVFSMFFSGGLIPNYLLVSRLGLINTRFAILLPFCINTFNLILLINFFKSIPNDIEEAAIIDGLGYGGILTKIILPLSGAGLATVGLYTAVFFWNDWFNSLIYLKSSQFPVMLYLRNIVNGTTQLNNGGGSSAEAASLSMSIKAAVIIVSTLPIILVYPFVQRYFVKGVMVGSVKG
ncbi:MAG: carbohydrate ABC transporter permease [Bullifex sp.]|nr:carbohydrate ABC transporter permease [Spirochaetales bacterium]MDY5055971.1 carbohydrate ABC transporter permease [Bullifex sp.]MDY5776610.1 carbohydrate ABC transporter permease [Bullifex sp.]